MNIVYLKYLPITGSCFNGKSRFTIIAANANSSTVLAESAPHTGREELAQRIAKHRMRATTTYIAMSFTG